MTRTSFFLRKNVLRKGEPCMSMCNKESIAFTRLYISNKIIKDKLCISDNKILCIQEFSRFVDEKK